jgi:hypothetical protein
MASKQRNDPGPPMTLGNMRELGIRGFMKTALTCLALIIASGTTTAQQEFDLSDPNVAWSVNELSREMLECAVFFAVGAQCVRGHPDQPVHGVVPDVTQAFQDMLDLGVKTGRTAGLSDAAATARRNRVTDAMLKSMGGNCINIGVVLERYANFCGQLRRDADPRLKELRAGQTCSRTYRCGP